MLDREHHGVDGDRRGEIRLAAVGSFEDVASVGIESYNNCLLPKAEPSAKAPDWEAQMEIFGAGGTQGPQPIYPRLAALSVDAGQTVQAGAPRDHVEISPLGQMLDGIGQLPEIRYEKVEAIRHQIATGAYETPEKLELALDRMLDELLGW